MRLATGVLILLLQAQSVPPGVRVPCTADTMISMSHGEELLNGGARSTLRLKGIEDLALVDFDLSPFKGKKIDQGRLFFFPIGDHKLKAIGLSTVGSPWKEGHGSGEPAKPGEPCFREAARGERPWGRTGGDLHDVTFGRGGSIWFARDLKSEADGWASVELPPELLHAILEGNSFGLCLSDERGQTGHNNSIYSREQNAKAPYLVVVATSGAAPPSGAHRFAPPPAKKIADHASEFLKKPAPPPTATPATLSDGCRVRVLFEGELNPAAPPAGRIWDGRSVSLVSARGEHVGFEIALETPSGESRAVRFNGEGWNVERVLPVGSAFDPLVPVAGDVTGAALFHVERYVPKTARPGPQKLTLTIQTGKAELALPVDLKVCAATLPDALSFHVSLNAYHSPGDVGGDKWGSPGYLALERAYHRLAHEHRATLAIVPYSQRGNLDWNVVPATRRTGAKVEVTSWKEYDERWDPYFEGSAFKGLPRDGVPLDHYYWPHHENWPLPINDYYAYRGKAEDHWRDAPPADRAFAEEYGKTFTALVHEFGAHAASKGWTRTMFQVFLNDKPDIRFHRHEPEGAWWRLDEPVSLEDHLALRYFALRTKEATKDLKGHHIFFRTDISRPQWRRDTLDGLVDLDVVAGTYREYPDFVFVRGEAVWIYGGVPGPGGSGEAARAWSLQVFLDGGDGVVPWLALGSPQAWDKPEDVALLLPPKPGMEKRPYATLRLKGLRRGQQDAELLRLLLEKKRWTREEIRAGVAEALGLRSSFVKTSEVDAGTVDFGKLDPDRFEAVRRSVLDALEAP